MNWDLQKVEKVLSLVEKNNVYYKTYERCINLPSQTDRSNAGTRRNSLD